MKILKFEGDWVEPLTKVCLRRQSWAKYLGQIKEIKQNWARARNFDNYFRVIFSRYYGSFISGWKTWCLVLGSISAQF